MYNKRINEALCKFEGMVIVKIVVLMLRFGTKVQVSLQYNQLAYENTNRLKPVMRICFNYFTNTPNDIVTGVMHPTVTNIICDLYLKIQRFLKFA